MRGRNRRRPPLAAPEPDRAANRHRKRWVGLLGCLSAIALIVLVATLIAWWTQSGIFAPPRHAPVTDGVSSESPLP